MVSKYNRGGKAKGAGGQTRKAKVGVKAKKSGAVMDARLKIIRKKRSGMVDARDMLAKMAKTTDAREKLQKIRNLKAGKMDVKKTKTGAITITKTIQGKVVLTTKKKEAAAAAKRGGKNAKGLVGVKGAAAAAALSAAGVKTTKAGNLSKKISRGGTISITTKKKTESGMKSQPKRSSIVTRPARGGRRGGSGAVLTRTIKGELSAAAKLDGKSDGTFL